MNGSWLGRGRGGRLAIYAGCTLVLIFIMLLYRAASLEMSRLRKINELCTNQQEALANQLQVIYDYKVRLEKFLADEKSSNAAVKQELQQRASREKSLRDKDSVEAMQRFNALQQSYKLLQTENQDLEELFKNFKTKAANETKKYIFLVQQLKDEIKAAQEDKQKSMEHLKSKYMELENEKGTLEVKYNELLKANGDTGIVVEHLRKEITQLKRELDAKKISKENVASLKAVSKGEKIPAEKVPDEKKTNPVSADRLEQHELVQSSPLIHFQNTTTNAVKAVVSAAVPHNRNKTTVSTASSAKVENAPLNAIKAKIKLPVGVVPIPILPNDREFEKKLQEEAENTKEAAAVAKHSANGAIHNDKQGVKNSDIGNLAMLALDAKHIGKEILDRQNNGGWMQEVGDEDNVHERLPGFDDPGHLGDLGDENYDNEFYKDRPQKNDEEGEDEREDDVLMDYPINNIKAEKNN